MLCRSQCSATQLHAVQNLNANIVQRVLCWKHNLARMLSGSLHPSTSVNRGLDSIDWEMCMKRVVLVFWTSVLGASIPGLVAAQSVNTIDPALRDRIDRITTGIMEQGGAPSATIAVVKGGKLVYAHA